MAILTLNKNLIEAGKRVFNGKALEGKENGLSDNEAIITLVEKAFNSNNNSINNLQAYRDLNNLIVITADETAQADLQQVIDLVAVYKKANPNDLVKYEINDHITKVNSVYTATGTGVDFTRIPTYRKYTIAAPRKHQFGAKYSISDMVNSPINAFNQAVQLVAQEKVRYTVAQIYAVARAAVTNTKVPTKQVAQGANVTFSQFKGVETSLLRYGRNVRPVVIGDQAILTSLAETQATLPAGAMTNVPLFLTDELRQSLLRDVTFDMISKSIAIYLDNPYTNVTNSKVDLPYNEALMIAGGSVSPFRVTDFGDMAVLTDEISDNIETEEVHMKISYKVDITLLLGQAIGYIKDTAITL
jgi:hypothetical protein